MAGDGQVLQGMKVGFMSNMDCLEQSEHRLPGTGWEAVSIHTRWSIDRTTTFTGNREVGNACQEIRIP